MLNFLHRSAIGYSLILFSIIFMFGCQQDDLAALKTPSATPTSEDNQPAKISQKPGSPTPSNLTATGTHRELLYGKWQPIAYIDVNGQQMDLNELSESQKASLSWEFTPNGTIKLGEIEGSFAVEGNQIIAKNKTSGNEKRFEFSVSETELIILSDDGATLKLSKEL